MARKILRDTLPNPNIILGNFYTGNFTHDFNQFKDLRSRFRSKYLTTKKTHFGLDES